MALHRQHVASLASATFEADSHSVGGTLGALDGTETQEATRRSVISLYDYSSCEVRLEVEPNSHWAGGAWLCQNTGRSDFRNGSVEREGTVSGSTSCVHYTLRNSFVVESMNLLSSVRVIERKWSTCSCMHPSNQEKLQ